MKIYTVGGAVRDELLGLEVKDRDHVVVGATPEELERLGFKPVGADFPVFLHPDTHEEYALARTERKTGRGYKGFTVYATPDVTLEQDLARRDLTINAMAKDETGRLIDPFGGAADLRAGVLRHVGPAFTEDPVRVLRVARFAARYGFAIAPETMALMQEIVTNGEVDALVPERVWQEFARGLMERTPRRMLEVLAECGALPRLLPEWTRLDPNRALGALDAAVAQRLALPVRFAALLVGAAVETAAQAAARLRVPNDCAGLAVIAAGRCGHVSAAPRLGAEALVDVLQQVDAFRRPERFESFVDVCECDAIARGHADPKRRARLLQALAAAQSIDAGSVAQSNPEDIPSAVRAARIGAVNAALVREP
jgi:tRNA nucleotidyltransferase (CCA-adding enzyme)